CVWHCAGLSRLGGCGGSVNAGFPVAEARLLLDAALLSQSMAREPVRLTQYSHGARCGCKLSPRILSEMLRGIPPQIQDPQLLVAYEGRDDAAAYAIDDHRVLLSTTDFFTPIVDDPFDFGAIAS